MFRGCSRCVARVLPDLSPSFTLFCSLLIKLYCCLHGTARFFDCSLIAYGFNQVFIGNYLVVWDFTGFYRASLGWLNTSLQIWIDLAPANSCFRRNGIGLECCLFFSTMDVFIFSPLPSERKRNGTLAGLYGTRLSPSRFTGIYFGLFNYHHYFFVAKKERYHFF